jgi:hypothetical protein
MMPTNPHDQTAEITEEGAVADNYERLKAEVQRLRAEGRIDEWPSREQRIDWAYGNSRIENADVTREMAEEAADRKPSSPK